MTTSTATPAWVNWLANSAALVAAIEPVTPNTNRPTRREWGADTGDVLMGYVLAYHDFSQRRSLLPKIMHIAFMTVLAKAGSKDLGAIH
jgi:hypothetical protein